MCSTLPLKISYSSFKQKAHSASTANHQKMLVFPTFVSVSSFPSHLSHLSCNRLSPFAVAPAFIEYVPQGVRVIVCLFLKAGVESKDHSWMHRTGDVGVSKQQSTMADTDLTCFSSQIAIRLGEYDEVFGTIYHHHFISQVSCACMLYFVLFFFFFLSIIAFVWRG